MKQGQFSQEQITRILLQAQSGEQTISQICRQHGITETTFYRWRNRFGSMNTDEAQRLRTLEQENARLKRLLAERDLEVTPSKRICKKSRYAARPSPTGGVFAATGHLAATRLLAGNGASGQHSIPGAAPTGRGSALANADECLSALTLGCPQNYCRPAARRSGSQSQTGRSAMAAGGLTGSSANAQKVQTASPAATSARCGRASQPCLVA